MVDCDDSHHRRSGAVALLEQLFPGESEMARRLRATNWSQTALGPVSNWSPTLRTLVGFLLANRFPLLLWWGPEYVQIYNDAYIPVPGTKHPGSVGQRASECWPEIWYVIGPLIDTPFRGGPATWMDDLELEVYRHGFTEETHFTVAYSPVPDNSAPGGIGGVLATVHEITQQVIQDRRVRILRDLGARAPETRTAEDACKIAADVFGQNPKDIPFAAIYLLDAGSTAAHLMASAGVVRDAPCAPAVIALDADSDGTWPLATVVRSEQTAIVTDLATRFAEIPDGPWAEPPQRAIVVPIRSHLSHHPAGIAVFGVSARIALDDYYQSFFELATAQIATAIANARAYEQERQRAEALAAIDRAKTTFFSNISHEFRTPLTLLLGPLEDALSAPLVQQEPEWRERLELMRRNALRLQRLVNTLLDFSRIEAGRIEANYEPVDLSAFTMQLASMFDSAMIRAGLRLSIDCPPMSEPAYVDRDMWEKIVMNLLSNAFKFTFQGEITVSLRQTADVFELCVRDTGVGIPSEEMPRLFERFHRIRHAQARTHEGTGIGLAFVQELVRLHDGDIRADSLLGSGTAFTVRIPRGAAHLPADRINATRILASTALGATPFVEEALRWLPDAPPSTAALPVLRDTNVNTTAPSRSMPCGDARVLIAEDSADMRDYLRGLLEQYWSVETAPDGLTALRVAQDRAPDLVVSDIMMPGLDGLELLQALRNDERTKDLPVILLSARAGEDAAVEALEAGADAYLVKPFSARELVAYVAGHLQLHRLRRESQAALGASEAKFSAAFNQSPLALTITALGEGRLVEVNDGFVRLSGYTREEALGRTVDELNLWIEPQRRVEGLALLRAGQRISESEIRLRTKTGQERIGVVGSVLIELNGRPHVLSSVVDITDRKRSEALLAADLQAFTILHQIADRCTRAGNEWQRCLSDILDAAIALTGADKGNIQLLDIASGTLTIAAQRGFAEPFLQFFARVDPHDPSACSAALRSGRRVIVEDVTQESVFVGQDSLAVLLAAGVRAVQSTPLVSSAGNLLGMISTHFGEPHRLTARELRLLDLLTRQTADYLERRQADEALRQRNAQFETLLNQAPLGVYLVDAEFRIRQVNPTALPTFGNIPDLIGRDFDEVIHILWTKQYADEMVRIFRHTLDTGEPYATPERQEFRIDRGVIEYYEWRVARITLAEGKYGVVCYFRDISAQVSAREQLAAVNATLKETDRRKDEFLAMLGHELRNPLSAVRNAVAIASLDASQRARALEIARRQTDQLGRLIDDLLDVARLTQGRISLHKERVDLTEIIGRAIENTQPFIESRGVGLEVALTGAPMHLDADPARLEQVFVNLLTNAGKYTDLGGRISVVAECRHETAAVRIRDTGIGITREVLSRMWDLFAQAERSLDRSQGGLGIGLTVARRLIELHGGRIEAHSDGPGKGAEFVVTLPLLMPANEVAATSTPAPPARRGVRVLLVEDNPDAAESLSILLELLGHRVRVAHDGVAALEAAHANPPAVMLVDIGLPGMDGYEVARRVRRDPALKDIVLVALTGYGREEDKHDAMAAGFDYHLVKPVNPDALSGVVAHLRKDRTETPTTMH